MQKTDKRCGYVALIGRPNVGKSTLLNSMLGQKLCITSRKPQTTRHRILAVKTDANAQTIFLDTPGLSQTSKGALNHTLKRTALRVLREVDVIVFCLAGTQWGDDDRWIYQQFAKLEVPVIVAINKVDLVPQKDDLLPHINMLSQQCQAKAWMPMSAKNGQGVARLHDLIVEHLPTSSHFLFPSDQVTDRDDGFLIAELIREQCLLRFSQEVPHQLTAQVEYMQVKGDCLHVHACIWVAREGQKKILLGQQGQHMKHMGRRVRLALETMYAQKVCLKMWVKVKNDWSNRLQDLSKFGYDGA